MVSTVLFKACDVLKRRDGRVFRDPKPGEEPHYRTLPGGESQAYYEDKQRKDVRAGDIAVIALDSTLPSDKKEMEKDASKWVRAVKKRAELAEAITAALNDMTEVELIDTDRDIIAERIGECVAIGAYAAGNAIAGPVVFALMEAPKKPQPAAAKKNGATEEAHVDA